jgi:thiamine pyrophosphokinase
MASTITSISFLCLDKNQVKKGEVKPMYLGGDINSMANNTLKMIAKNFLQVQKQYNDFMKGETDLLQRKIYKI